MNGLKTAFVFLAGFAAGIAAAGVYFRSKYEAIADEEIASVKKAFERRTLQAEKNVPIPEKPPAENNNVSGKPYAISEEDFGMREDYETGTLFYYADKVLTDSNDKVMENCGDIKKLADSADVYMYGDSVYIRCDEIKTDYEVLFDDRTFGEKEGDAVR
ncbi:MAG: hypothetical protein NC120_13080 [Ruminococcus sp.]|nr:hypothetical protein [Ruminococcus sp.]